MLHQLYRYFASQLVTPTKRNMIQLHQETYNDILQQLKPNPTYSQEIQVYEPPIAELHSLSDEQKQYLKQSLQRQFME